MSAGTLKAWLTNEPTPDARPPKRRKGTQQTLFDLKKVVVLEDVYVSPAGASRSLFPLTFSSLSLI